MRFADYSWSPTAIITQITQCLNGIGPLTKDSRTKPRKSFSWQAQEAVVLAGTHAGSEVEGGFLCSLVLLNFHSSTYKLQLLTIR